ncbi:hypothetical protein BHM03_00015653 [Ensete ventricosum]|nr:hypothetical protein BHM03_00015653 [Ensete ventricosum]
MAPGRGSAVAMGLLALLCLLAHSEVAGAATFVVGDSRGWTFSTAGWPSGKRFRAGDVLGERARASLVLSLKSLVRLPFNYL